MVRGLGRCALAAACLPIVLLTGCPQQQPAASSLPAKATAPPVAAPAQPAAQATTSPPSAEAAVTTVKVQQLISQVEATYRSGVDNYRAGRPEAARSDFDASVDMMLTSKMDLKADPRLSDEFDHLLDAINTLEMA